MKFYVKGYLIPKTNGMARACDVKSVVEKLNSFTDGTTKHVVENDSDFEIIMLRAEFSEQPEELKQFLLSTEVSRLVEAGHIKFTKYNIQYETFEYSNDLVKDRYWNMM